MSVKNKLKKFLEHEGLSMLAFEKKIGSANGYVNSISRSIGIDKLKTISEKFPNLNLEWLLVDRGEMLKTSEKNEIISDDLTKRIKDLEYTIEVQKDLIHQLKKNNEVDETKSPRKEGLSSGYSTK